MKLAYSKKNCFGFTLIELMVAVAVVAILTGIALPNYRSYMEKGDRAAARAALLGAQQFMERFYTANDTYAADRAGNAVSLPLSLQKAPAESPKYDLSISAVAANSYTLTATPRANNTKCGRLTITNTGVRGAPNATIPVADCWK
ncbi:MAG: prepilin-type N-terminal cleavage/methylation domain-containing protein [Betaproteobacteria bacterium]|nr:prepilin-type N-terminal cleavage/methylation domain-containing protein [Betaproteobacteria bacterium]